MIGSLVLFNSYYPTPICQCLKNFDVKKNVLVNLFEDKLKRNMTNVLSVVFQEMQLIGTLLMLEQ